MLKDKVSIPQSVIEITDEIYDDGLLLVEHENFYVECAGKYLKLTRSEFLIISLLTQKSRRYVRAKSIWRYLWKDNRPLNIGSLRAVICTLRRRLEPYGIKIENMVNVGYRIVPHSKEKGIRTM